MQVEPMHCTKCVHMSFMSWHDNARSSISFMKGGLMNKTNESKFNEKVFMSLDKISHGYDIDPE